MSSPDYGFFQIWKRKFLSFTTRLPPALCYALLEGIALHAFDDKAPFSEQNLKRIRDLKKIYHLDFDSRANHRLRETPPPRKSKAKP